jgi:hypothetical protein
MKIPQNLGKISEKVRTFISSVTPGYRDTTGIYEKNLENKYSITNKARGLYPFKGLLYRGKKNIPTDMNAKIDEAKHHHVNVKGTQKNEYHEFGDLDRDNVNNKHRHKK